MKMTVKKDALTLILSGEPEQSIVLDESDLHRVFALVERNSMEQPVEIYRDGTRVGRIALSSSGLWEVDWHDSAAHSEH